ncbi:hypothetical protein ABZ599_39310 [Streptomyces misionensis]|uniref:hypothetical protein n=1 Tax=Streptomyces misionensis TaxID=67331 RepID=UPI0033D424B4
MVRGAALLRADALQPQVYEPGGESFSLAELAETITAAAGTTVTHTNPSGGEFAESPRATGLDDGLVTAFMAADASIAAGDMETHSTALADLIGGRTTPLADSIRRAL